MLVLQSVILILIGLFLMPKSFFFFFFFFFLLCQQLNDFKKLLFNKSEYNKMNRIFFKSDTLKLPVPVIVRFV